jgi:hypothetical protein
LEASIVWSFFCDWANQIGSLPFIFLKVGLLRHP